MRSFIVTGVNKDREKFIDKYIDKEGISKSSIIIFNQEIKALEAKQIRQILSKKYSEKHLILISSELNNIAQNSLLKNIEDLSENISIIISLNNTTTLLDTIKSRFFIIELGTHYELQDVESLLMFESVRDTLLAIDKFLLDSSDLSAEEQIERIIRAIRNDLVKSNSDINNDLLRVKIAKFRELVKSLSMVKTNNINLRFAIEAALI